MGGRGRVRPWFSDSLAGERRLEQVSNYHRPANVKIYCCHENQHPYLRFIDLLRTSSSSSLSAAPHFIWGVNNVYRFIGKSKVYHWRPKWGSDCSLLGEIRSLGKLGAIGSHWETPLHSFHQTIALRSMCFWCILLFRKKTPNANYTFWKIKHKKYYLSKKFCTTLIKEEKFSNDAAHF